MTTKILLGIMLGLIILLALDLGYQDAVAEHNMYCEQVRAGVWPNYRGIECK